MQHSVRDAWWGGGVRDEHAKLVHELVRAQPVFGEWSHAPNNSLANLFKTLRFPVDDGINIILE